MSWLFRKKTRKAAAKRLAALITVCKRTIAKWRPNMRGKIAAKSPIPGVFYWLASATETLLLPFHSVIALIVFGFALVWSDQGQDVLVKMIEYSQAASDFSVVLVFALAALLLGLSCWYAARLTYYSYAHTFIAYLGQHRRIQSFWPRILGGFPFLLIAWGLLKVSNGAPWTALLPIAFAALLYGVFVVYRRRIRRLKLKPVAKTHGKQESIRDLGWRANSLIGLSIVIAVLMIVAYGLGDPPGWITLSPGAVLAGGLAVLALAGTLISVVSHRYRLPCYAILVIWIAVAGYIPWTDNHAVRTDPAARWPAARKHVADALLERAGYAPSRAPAAFVIVAGQGGGIRAAYWTASVLARMQCMGLASGANGAVLTRRMLATSTVSGSSLGSAAFSAWLHSDGAWRSDRCEPSRDAIRRMLAGDFLAPVFASFLFPDLAQRIVPHPWFHDRAYVMELAWERQWAAIPDAIPELRPLAGLLAQPFPDFMSLPAAPAGGAPRALPVPFYNAAEVESGRRLIVAPMPFDEDNFHCVFKAADQAARLMPQPMRVSTAALMSARFPYITPAGRIAGRKDSSVDVSKPPGQGCREGTNLADDGGWMRQVDGGYYDNSGATTGVEIMRALADRLGPAKVRPVFIQIDNNPLKERAKDRQTEHKRLWFPETLSPPEAISHVGDGYARSAVEEARTAALQYGGIFAHFALCQYGTVLPLGWALSKRAQEEMDMQLGDRQSQYRISGYHSRQLKRIADFLRNPTPDPDPELGTIARAETCFPARPGD